MELRYEVSPSEAGIVVDGLHAQGVDATLLTRRLGDSVDTISVEVGDDGAAAVRDLVAELASDPVEVTVD